MKMAEPYSFIIYGHPATKKNSSVLVQGRARLLPSKAYRDYIRAKYFHTGNIGGLFGNINFTHINITFKPEICSRGCKSNTMLSCSGFCDQFFLSHVFCQQAFTHTMVQFVGSCMIQVLSFQINLKSAEQI